MTLLFDKIRKGILHRSVRLQAQKFVSWSVIGLLLLNVFSTAILPGLSSGIANAASPLTDREDVLVICTANGLKLIRLDEKGESEPVKRSSGGYCAFCLPLNHAFLCAPAVETVALDLAYVNVQLLGFSDSDRVVASFSLKPVGSQAPPVWSI